METLFNLSFEDEFKEAVGHVVESIVVPQKQKEKNIAWGKLRKLFPIGRQKVGNFEALTEEAMFDIVTASLAIGDTELAESYVAYGAKHLKERLSLIFTAINLVQDLNVVLQKHEVGLAAKDVLKLGSIEEAHNRLKAKGLLDAEHTFGWAKIATLTH